MRGTDLFFILGYDAVQCRDGCSCIMVMGGGSKRNFHPMSCTFFNDQNLSWTDVFVGLVMGSQGDKLDGLVRASGAIGAGDHAVIAFLAAYLAIQVNLEQYPLK